MRKVTRMCDLPAEARMRLELQLEKNYPSKTRTKKTKKIQSKVQTNPRMAVAKKMIFDKNEYEQWLKNKLN